MMFYSGGGYWRERELITVFNKLSTWGGIVRKIWGSERLLRYIRNMKCKNCGNELVQTEGRRKKVFCSNTCRASWHQKNKPPQAKVMHDIFDKDGNITKEHLEFVKSEFDRIKKKYGLTEDQLNGLYIDPTRKIEVKTETKGIIPISKEVKEQPVNGFKTLQQLKDACPKELTGFARSEWIQINRVKFKI